MGLDRSEGGHPQADNGGEGESESDGEDGVGTGHWLFSDKVDIDIQYIESGLPSIGNIEKRYSTDRITENPESAEGSTVRRKPEATDRKGAEWGESLAAAH